MRGGWLVIGLVVVLGVSAALFAIPARAQQPPDETANSVRVRGEGVVLAAPDVATLSLGATVRRETPSVAFSEAQAQAATLVERLQVQGVAANDIQTTNISLFPEYGPRTPEAPQPEVIAWRATYTFSAKVRDFTRIAAILEEAVALLGSDAQIQGIFFGIENTDALVSQARAEAFGNARAAAVELAGLAGAQLGEVITIEETIATPPTPLQAGPSPVARPPLATPLPAPQSGGDSFGGQVAPGQISVRVLLSVVFALERPAGT